MNRGDLLFHSRPVTDGETLRVARGAAGFEYLSFYVRSLPAGGVYPTETGEEELALVVLGGECEVRSSRGSWRLGGRRNVFDGLPHTLYLPRRTALTVEAVSACEIAFCFCLAEQDHPARLVRPEDVEIEIRGGSNATRTIYHIVKPDFPAHRLLIVEVYTPSGNWSSYPPHKHDVHNPPHEVDLEEIYYYRINRPEGFAIQQLYTKDRSLDETFVARDGDLILIPEGYHPVVAGFGYDAYYLNVLAGSARSMAASDDPQHAWVRNTWAAQRKVS